MHSIFLYIKKEEVVLVMLEDKKMYARDVNV